MNLVPTISEMITSQKNAKSNADARSDLTRGCSADGIDSVAELLAA